MFPPVDVPAQEGVYRFMDLIHAQPAAPVDNVPSLEDLGALIYTGDNRGSARGAC